MLSEVQYIASGGFGVVSGPRSSSFFALRTQCLAPWFWRGLWFRRVVDALRTQCLAPGFGGGCVLGSVDAKHGRSVRVRDLALVLVLYCELCCLGPWGLLLGRKAFAGESTTLFGTNSAATKQPSNFHLYNTPKLVTTQSRETTKGTNRYTSSALDR